MNLDSTTNSKPSPSNKENTNNLSNNQQTSEKFSNSEIKSDSIHASKQNNISSSYPLGNITSINISQSKPKKIINLMDNPNRNLKKNLPKIRNYKNEYLIYGFYFITVENIQLTICLLCNSKKTFSNSSLKPAKLIEHQKFAHKDSLQKEKYFFDSLL